MYWRLGFSVSPTSRKGRDQPGLFCLLGERMLPEYGLSPATATPSSRYAS